MGEQNQHLEQAPEEFPREPGTTGRYMITIDPAVMRQGVDVLGQIGVNINQRVQGGEVDPEVLNSSEAAVFFEDAGIVIAGLSQEQVELITARVAEGGSPLQAIEQERVYSTLDLPPDSAVQ